MNLSGKVSSDLPLLVLALAEEAQSLDTGLPVLLTGIGKVNAACALAGVLGRGPLPARIVNLGTTRALRPGLNGIHRVNTVIQHDLDTDVLRTSALLDLDDGRLAAMDGAGIDTAVLSLTTPGLQNLAGTEAVALQGPTNDATATAGPVTVTAAGLARWGLIGAIGEPGTAG